MKKSFFNLAWITLAAVFIVEMFSCSDGSSGHVHTFATEWTKDATHHWHAATCEHIAEVKDKAEHNFGEWTIIEQPSEEVEDKRERICSDCQYLAVEVIAKLDHVHVKGTFHEAVASTCKTKGIIAYYDCTKVECEIKLDADGNPLDSTESDLNPSNHEGADITFEAVDSDNHKEKYKCCNAVKTESAPHIWNDGEVTKTPSTTEEGVKTFTCTAEGCGQTKTESIKKLPVSIPAGEVAKANLTINGTEIVKTSEVVVIPAGTVATIEITDDSAWSGYVESDAYDSWKGVFLKGRKVKLSPFIMGQYPVTIDLYKAVMGEDVSTAPSHETQGENPVNNVNWFDAIVFCNRLSVLEGLDPVYSYNLNGIDETDPDKWIADKENLGPVPLQENYANYLNWFYGVKIDLKKNGYRLPTETEWEFAARGGDPSKPDWKFAFSGVNASDNQKIGRSTGSDENVSIAKDSKLEEVGWYYVNSKTDNTQGTHEVGLKKANRLNLYDMSGNIQEWCNDYFGGSEKPEDNENIIDGYVIDPVGPSAGSGRIQRGGDYANYARCCAVSSRGCSKPYARGLAYGFRICRSVN